MVGSAAMPLPLRPLLAGLLTFTLVNCQCGQPAVEDPCIPEYCAGCCVEGMCRACEEPAGGGGGAQDAGGPAAPDGGWDAGPVQPPDAGGDTQPDSGTPVVPDAGVPDAGGGGQPGAVFFDGGWVLPVLPPQPALVGDGGTTVAARRWDRPSPWSTRRTA